MDGIDGIKVMMNEGFTVMMSEGFTCREHSGERPSVSSNTAVYSSTSSSSWKVGVDSLVGTLCPITSFLSSLSALNPAPHFNDFTYWQNALALINRKVCLSSPNSSDISPLRSLVLLTDALQLIAGS